MLGFIDNFIEKGEREKDKERNVVENMVFC